MLYSLFFLCRPNRTLCFPPLFPCSFRGSYGQSYTWHDKSTGGYYQKCYLVTFEADPWVTAGGHDAGHQSGLCDHSQLQPPPTCPPARGPAQSSNSCVDATVVCSATGATQILGKVGTGTASGKALVGKGGEVLVANCLEHLLDVGFDWPQWNAANYGGPSLGGCGAGDDYNETSYCVNRLDTTYNHPLWFGPWVSSIQASYAALLRCNKRTAEMRTARVVCVSLCVWCVCACACACACVVCGGAGFAAGSRALLFLSWMVHKQTNTCHR